MSEVFQRQLLAMSDEDLLTLVRAGTGATNGIGACCTCVVEDEKIFVKRLPLSDIEADQAYSTRNHFDLPTVYSYGVGSLGFGPWRELAALQALHGVQGFPSLLHHRVMPSTAVPAPLPWTEEEYVHYWNDSQAVGRYVQARNAATQELWLVLEHGGTPADVWLGSNLDNIDVLLGQVFDAIGELQDRQMVHFDAHFGNIVTDGRRCQLVDFGLAMSTDFELSSEERVFLDEHRHYDYGWVLGNLGIMLAVTVGAEPSIQSLRHQLDDLRAIDGKCPPTFLGAIDRYREPMLYMLDFFERMRQPDKHSIYDDRVLAGLLHECGVVTS
jgi:hypothetical protein